MKMSATSKDEAIKWALAHGMAFKASPSTARHVPFSLTPTGISLKNYQQLQAASELIAQLMDAVSRQDSFLDQAISPVAANDPFFAALLKMHRSLYQASTKPERVPLLVIRSDFLDDKVFGPRLVEANSIAAGMGPFGAMAHKLHQFLLSQGHVELNQNQTQTPVQHPKQAQPLHIKKSALIENPAIERLASAIAAATLKIKHAFNDDGPARFLMLVQQDEDNVFDQHLLEQELQQLGIHTIRRTFSELEGQLTTGAQHRLMLNEVGSIDTVYLRTGYQFKDYLKPNTTANYSDFMAIRVLIERHKVAVNATVSQQLATSKRVQMLLSHLTPSSFSEFGLTMEQATFIKPILGDMLAINANSINEVSSAPLDTWVLKNQGEGGGHCLFGADIASKLAQLTPADYPEWLLMRRIHPRPSITPTLVVRHGELEVVHDLVAEMGMFNVWFDGKPALANCPLPQESAKSITTMPSSSLASQVPNSSFAGYLIRSKSAKVNEAGVHSGQGVLDSLMLIDSD
ncbi:MAG: glutathione synthase [Shewanella sp.]